MDDRSLESWGNADEERYFADFLADVGEGVSRANDDAACRDGGVGVVVLTGVQRLALDAVAFSLSDSCPACCVISYDVTADEESPAGLSIVRTLRKPASLGRIDEGDVCMFAMTDCCMTCAVKHDAARMLRDYANRSDVFLVSLPVGVEGAPVAEFIAESSVLGDVGRPVRAVGVVTAVDLETFEESLFDDEPLLLAGCDEHDAVLDSRSAGVVQARLIREAGHVLMLPMFAPTSLTLDKTGDDAEAARVRSLAVALADPHACVHDDAHAVNVHELLQGAEVMR